MLPSNIQRNLFGEIGMGGVRTQDRQSWQWQPTLTVHSPNPPITIKSPVVASLVAQARRLLGLIGR